MYRSPEIGPLLQHEISPPVQTGGLFRVDTFADVNQVTFALAVRG